MSKGQLKTRLRFLAHRRAYAPSWAVCVIAMVTCAALGCAVDTSEPYPEDIDQEEPEVVTGPSLDPSSIEQSKSGGTDDGPGGKHETEETTSGLSTDEEEEPDPDPWQIPSLPGNPDGDGDEGSSGEDPP